MYNISLQEGHEKGPRKIGRHRRETSNVLPTLYDICRQYSYIYLYLFHVHHFCRTTVVNLVLSSLDRAQAWACKRDLSANMHE